MPVRSTHGRLRSSICLSGETSMALGAERAGMSARDPGQARRTLGFFRTLIVAAVFLPVLGLTLLIILGVSGPLFLGIEPTIGGVGGAGSADVTNLLGDALKVLGAAGALAVPGSIALALFMRGRRDEPRQPPGPF